MKTTNDILNLFYSVLNVATVTDVAGGSICRIEKDLNSEEQDIVLRPLSISGPLRKTLQDGTIQINCYAQNHLKTGRPNETYFNSINSAVISQLEGFSDLSTYFTFDIVSQNIFPDTDNSKMSYSNIRVNYLIEK